MSSIEPNTTLTVVTWNLHGSARPALDEVAARLESFAADVVGLQETQPWQARRLARRLGWHHRWARKHLPFGPFVWWRAEGLATLSPHELSGHDRLVLNPSSSGFSYRRRVAQRAVVGRDPDAFRFVNTHLASHHAPPERAAQAAVVAGWVAADDGGHRRPTLLTGDLNAENEPATLAPLAAIGLCDAWVGDGSGFTNPAGRVRQRLDYVLVDAMWQVVEACVPDDGPAWAALSDHLPVIIRVRRAARSAAGDQIRSK